MIATFGNLQSTFTFLLLLVIGCCFTNCKKEPSNTDKARNILKEGESGYAQCSDLHRRGQKAIAEAEKAFEEKRGSEGMDWLEKSAKLIGEASECQARWRDHMHRELKKQEIPDEVSQGVWDEWVKTQAETAQDSH